MKEVALVGKDMPIIGKCLQTDMDVYNGHFTAITLVAVTTLVYHVTMVTAITLVAVTTLVYLLFSCYHGYCYYSSSINYSSISGYHGYHGYCCLLFSCYHGYCCLLFSLACPT